LGRYKIQDRKLMDLIELEFEDWNMQYTYTDRFCGPGKEVMSEVKGHGDRRKICYSGRCDLG